MSPFKNITIYGAGGDNIGKYILDALLAEGTFKVSVLSRQSSKSVYPSSVEVLRVPDSLPHEDLVQALQGQDVVVSAVGFGSSALETQYKVIDAAIEAGVKRFMPSEYGMDNADPKNLWLSPVFKAKGKVAEYLDAKSKEFDGFSWTGVATGMWLEWALEVKFLGVDPVKTTVSYWDGGEYAPSHTTLSYAAQGVVEVLKHPEETKNKRVFLEAFAASQREIVAELEKQQGVKYKELEPVDGAKTVEDLHHRWNASGQTDVDAAITTVVAGILMGEYRADFVKSGKKPMLEDLAKMPKVTLQDVVRTVVERQG